MDRVLSLVAGRRGSEAVAESDVTIESFFGGDEFPGSEDFVFHGFDAEAAEPPALESVANAGDVRRSAVLGEAASVAFDGLDLELQRSGLGRRRRSGIGVRNRH